MSKHGERKTDHLDLCATDRVAFRDKTTLLEQVELIHDALPELALDEIDLSASLVGRPLKAPLLIAAMTGGLPRAERINKDLAEVAEAQGIAFGFGSMRPLLEEGVQLGYRVRDVAPTAVVLGNIGVMQARKASTQALAEMVGVSGCDALCVHLNPAMEVIQGEGDRDFRGGLDTLSRLHEELDIPIIVKETGCGLSRRVATRLVTRGLRWVDVSGAGGTSWVGVETLRGNSHHAGQRFWDWGIPTAASIAQLSGLGLGVIATGGLRHGLDLARALALGASVGGLARPFLQAYNQGGATAVHTLAQQIIAELRLAHLLAGASSSHALRAADLVLGPDLQRWVPSHSPLGERVRRW